MKQLVAIAFSLLLIVAQTFAVQASVSSVVPVAKRSCCGDDCHCCVSQSGGAPFAPPVEPAAPAAAQNQFVFPPVVAVIFTLALPTGSLASAASSDSRVDVLPLFRRNCVFLI